jgi:hypothetical protein
MYPATKWTLSLMLLEPPLAASINMLVDNMFDRLLVIANFGALALALRAGWDFAAACWGVARHWDADDAL